MGESISKDMCKYHGKRMADLVNKFRAGDISLQEYMDETVAYMGAFSLLTEQFLPKQAIEFYSDTLQRIQTRIMIDLYEHNKSEKE